MVKKYVVYSNVKKFLMVPNTISMFKNPIENTLNILPIEKIILAGIHIKIEAKTSNLFPSLVQIEKHQED